MKTLEQVPGYVRCNVTHIGAHWSFDLLSEEHEVAIVTIETEDGKIVVGLNHEDATTLLNSLSLFITKAAGRS